MPQNDGPGSSICADKKRAEVSAWGSPILHHAVWMGNRVENTLASRPTRQQVSLEHGAPRATTRGSSVAQGPA